MFVVFEALLGLKINLDKTNVILVGEVSFFGAMFQCRVPMPYLGYQCTTWDFEVEVNIFRKLKGILFQRKWLQCWVIELAIYQFTF